MSEYYQGRIYWAVSAVRPHHRIEDESRRLLGTMEGDQADAQANCQRIQDAWNACAGVKQLSPGLLAEALEALATCVDALNPRKSWSSELAQVACRGAAAVLARTGR